MEIKIGDIIKYFFPSPVSRTKHSIVGHVDYIGDSFIFIKSRDNIRVKVSFKNFGKIKKIGSLELLKKV
jgi:hypothetical protein